MKSFALALIASVATARYIPDPTNDYSGFQRTQL
jgi:hypothetical protein